MEQIITDIKLTGRKRLYTFFMLIMIFSGTLAQTDSLAPIPIAFITVNDSSDINQPVAMDSVIINKPTAFKLGTASFYAKSFEGRKTANGDIFRHTGYTAASNVYKLNTWVRVTNMSNDKSVIVRINDRMAPSMSKKGRVVDLTRTAASELNFINKGVTRVKVEAVPKGTEL